jgi:hypothetical protein
MLMETIFHCQSQGGYMAREEEIKLIAYQIWEQEGCSDGHDREHWYRAETIWEQQKKKEMVAAKPIAAAISPAKQIKRAGATRKQPRKK